MTNDVDELRSIFTSLLTAIMEFPLTSGTRVSSSVTTGQLFIARL